ncbi:MAG: hypothetical protein R3D98_03090 [Candidatus Krumholzibacteriia bacterium]
MFSVIRRSRCSLAARAASVSWRADTSRDTTTTSAGPLPMIRRPTDSSHTSRPSACRRRRRHRFGLVAARQTLQPRFDLGLVEHRPARYLPLAEQAVGRDPEEPVEPGRRIQEAARLVVAGEQVAGALELVQEADLAAVASRSSATVTPATSNMDARKVTRPASAWCGTSVTSAPSRDGPARRG